MSNEGEVSRGGLTACVVSASKQATAPTAAVCPDLEVLVEAEGYLRAAVQKALHVDGTIDLTANDTAQGGERRWDDGAGRQPHLPLLPKRTVSLSSKSRKISFLPPPRSPLERREMGLLAALLGTRFFFSSPRRDTVSGASIATGSLWTCAFSDSVAVF